MTTFFPSFQSLRRVPAGIMCVLAATGLATFAHADPIPIDFVENSGGFSEGSINGQNDWVVRSQAPANGDFVFKPGVGLEVKENTGGTHGAAYAYFTGKESPEGRDTPESGMATSFTADFVINQSAEPRKAPIFGLGWGLYVPVGFNNLPFFIDLGRDSEAGGYRIRLAKPSEKTKVEGEMILNVPEADLGLNSAAGDNVSDPLQLSFTITNEGSVHDWTTVGMLTNLTTNKTFVLKNTITAPEVYKKDGIVRTLINNRHKGADGLTSVIITKIDAAVTPDPTVQ